VGTLGGAFFWTWPVVALGQFIVAMNFAEVSTHFPVAGSVFQWTKYLSTLEGRTPGSPAGSTCGRAP
jgi:amino acid transporter